MSDLDPAAPEHSVHQLPRDTTPTWEVELLLSGALVFATLQVPGWLDQALYALQPRLSGSLHYGAFMLYFYLKITTYALICTFVLHLASRAIWVAALGLRSVYPEGIDWERLKRGPIFRAYAGETVGSLAQTIDQADNRASKVFAFGLVLTLMSLAIMLFTMGLVALTSVAAWWWPALEGNTWLGFALVALLVVPVVGASLFDRHFGHLVSRGGIVERAIRFCYRLSSWMVWGRLTNPFLLTVISRLGVRRGNLLMVGALYGLMAVILVEVLLRNGVLQLPGERLLPETAAGRELRSAWYADQRSAEDTRRGQPYIQSVHVPGPYLRVFVPWIARRVEGTVRRECPQAIPSGDELPESEQRSAERERIAALLECAGTRLHPLQLDGEPLAADYQLGDDPLSGLRGFVAMVPVQSLAAGRHELAVGRPPKEGEDEPQKPVLIPFWR